MNVLTVFLLCFTATYAVTVYLPSDSTLIYNYHTDVKVGTIKPAQYASQFSLAGQLHVRKEVSDPTLNNAYRVKLQHIKYGMYNGMAAFNETIQATQELKKAAQQIEDSFLIVYNENGKLQGIKISDTENGWSKNIKQAIASMLQLDLLRIQFQTPMKSQAFVTTENNIHGTCQVAYNVQPVNPDYPTTANYFLVTKLHDLKNCSHFVQRVFNQVECEKCHMEYVDDMTTSAKRVFLIQKLDNNSILFESVIADSVINYFPYNGRSEAHYLLTTTSLKLDRIAKTSKDFLRDVNFQNLSLIRDVTFNKPLGNYALHAAEDLTHGRHIVKADLIVSKLQKMLLEAADYLDEHHMEAEEPNWKHGQTINRLQHIMGYMDLPSLEQTYNAIQDMTKNVMIKNIFLEIIPTVGTTATSHFTRNLILNHEVTDDIAIAMLMKLPMHVKVPSEKLLLEMEDLLKLNNTVSLCVKKASILCFSTLIRKTFMHHQDKATNSLLQRYLYNFFEHIKNDQIYEMKLVYLMAMKNVQLGNIEELLEPIIRGDILISEHPHDIRMLAIDAIHKAVADKVDYTHNVLWPILANVTEPLIVRTAAYDVLMSQLPNMRRLMNIYWLMVSEPNNHLYNYHLSTLKGLANSVSSCLTPIREMARKVIRFTRIRPNTTTLSYKQFVDYVDPIYGHGESFDTALLRDELTGLPRSGYIKHYVSTARKPVDEMGIYWNINGLDKIMKVIKQKLFRTRNLTNKKVKDILNLVAQDMLTKKDIYIEFHVTLNGNIITVDYYDENTLKNLLNNLKLLQERITDFKSNFQKIMYENLYEMQISNDIGMQVVFSTKKPYLTSWKFNNIFTEIEESSVNLNLDVDTRIWGHGEYVMSVYNPIVDTWHSIRKAMAQDVVLPLKMDIEYNRETNNVKFIIPMLFDAKLLYTGVRYYAKDLVTVTEDEESCLNKCCASCQNHIVVTSGEQKNYYVGTDSRTLGLKIGMSIFKCENKITPTTETLEWHRALSPDHKNVWNSKLIQYMMGIRQKLRNNYISPEMGSCGVLMKMEPSIIYPISQIDLTIQTNITYLNLFNTSELIHGKKINVRGTLDAKAVSTNESTCLWDMNINIDMIRGLLLNDVKNVNIEIMRAIPGEKNLKICINAYELDRTKEKADAKMIVTAGFTDDDKCVSDEMLISTTIRNEMTEEQRKQMVHDYMNCIKISYADSSCWTNRILKLISCMNKKVEFRTMRKYVINTSYKKVPAQVFSYINVVEDIIRASYFPHLKYITDRVESGSATLTVEFPFDMTNVNISVVTPISGYKYLQIPLHDTLFEGMIMNNQSWYPTWYNKQESLKICDIDMQTLLTFDNRIIPFAFSGQWVLLSGDYIDESYAIFAKSQWDNLAVKMSIEDDELNISELIRAPHNKNFLMTAFNNHLIHMRVPEGHLKTEDKVMTLNTDSEMDSTFKIVGSKIQSRKVPMIVIYTPNRVTLIAESTSLKYTTGLCGPVDDMHKEKIAKIYGFYD